jgi:hypothetical protein
LRLRSLPRGARPLLLLNRLLNFLGFHLSPAFLAADISLRRTDFLCVWPDECTSFAGAVVSRLVTTLPLSGCLPVYGAACLPQPLPPRHSQVCLGRLSTPAAMGLGEGPRSRTC